MYRNINNHAVFSVVGVLAAVLAAIAPRIANADSVTPAALQSISGGGQIASLNQSYPLPLVVRVVAADGSPVAGVPVQFEAPHCSNDGMICALPTDYAYFPSHQIVVTAISDTNGFAKSPNIRAGGVQENLHPFTASVFVGSPPDQVVLQTVIKIWQVVSLEVVPITSGFTGSWYDPEQSGQGLSVEILPNDRVVVSWHTFTPDGMQQAWFSGVGQVVHGQAVVNAIQPKGGRWIPFFDSSQINNQFWGTLTLVFSDCDHGRVYFSGADGTGIDWSNGAMELTRLTLPVGLSCP